MLGTPGDRVVTPWLKLIGKGAPDVPLLDVALTRSGAALVSASVKASHPSACREHGPFERFHKCTCFLVYGIYAEWYTVASFNWFCSLTAYVCIAGHTLARRLPV